MTAVTVIIAVIVLLVAALVVLILVGNRISDRTYKPTIAEVIQHLEDCNAGQMDRFQYDEFSSCRIAYDPRLDAIRKQFNEITDDPQNIEGSFSETDATALNELGMRKIDGLIDELGRMKAEDGQVKPG